MRRNSFSVILIFLTVFAGVQKKPVLYIIGDSTVKNGDGKGGNGQWGWGSLVNSHFDTANISIRNHAIGGRSSRTFITQERWLAIMKELKKGDYVLIQFGHNDGGPLDDTARARGTLKGIGNDSVEIYNPITKVREVVHSYGWYMRKYISDARSVGAIPIICSPVPRNNKKDGKIPIDNYAVWSKEVAMQTKTYYVPLNEMIATEYNKMDSISVDRLFYGDRTHTSWYGAEMNAALVAKGLKKLKIRELNDYIMQ